MEVHQNYTSIMRCLIVLHRWGQTNTIVSELITSKSQRTHSYLVSWGLHLLVYLVKMQQFDRCAH